MGAEDIADAALGHGDADRSPQVTSTVGSSPATTEKARSMKTTTNSRDVWPIYPSAIMWHVVLCALCVSAANAADADLAAVLKGAREISVTPASQCISLQSPEEAERKEPSTCWTADLEFAVPKGFRLGFIDDSSDGPRSMLARVVTATTDAQEEIRLNGYDRAHQRRVIGGQYGHPPSADEPKLLLRFEFPIPERKCSKISEISGFLYAQVVSGEAKEVTIGAKDAMASTKVDVFWPPDAQLSLSLENRILKITGSSLAASTILSRSGVDANGAKIKNWGYSGSVTSRTTCTLDDKIDVPENGFIKLRMITGVEVVRLNYTAKNIDIKPMAKSDF